MVRVVWVGLTEGRRQGGSTIEQQFVRTVTSDFEFTLRRKLREMVLGTAVSRKVSKSRIAHSYLSVAYFGYGMQGLTAACNAQEKDINNLSAEDAAEVIAMLKYPRPKNYTMAWQQKVSRRAQHVLRAYRPANDAGPEALV